LEKPASLNATTGFLVSNCYAGQHPKPQHKFLRRKHYIGSYTKGNPTLRWTWIRISSACSLLFLSLVL